MSRQPGRSSARLRGGARESERLAAAMAKLFLGGVGAYELLLVFLPAVTPPIIGGTLLGGAGLGLVLTVWQAAVGGQSMGRRLAALVGQAALLLLTLYALFWILQNWVLPWLEYFPYNIAGGT